MRKKEIFTAFDLDNNGVIDLEEMQTVIRKEICAPLKKSEIRDMYKELDTDGDGTIDFDEFHRGTSLTYWIQESWKEEILHEPNLRCNAA